MYLYIDDQTAIIAVIAALLKWYISSEFGKSCLDCNIRRMFCNSLLIFSLYLSLSLSPDSTTHNSVLYNSQWWEISSSFPYSLYNSMLGQPVIKTNTHTYKHQHTVNQVFMCTFQAALLIQIQIIIANRKLRDLLFFVSFVSVVRCMVKYYYFWIRLDETVKMFSSKYGLIGMWNVDIEKKMHVMISPWCQSIAMHCCQTDQKCVYRTHMKSTNHHPNAFPERRNQMPISFPLSFIFLRKCDTINLTKWK